MSIAEASFQEKVLTPQSRAIEQTLINLLGWIPRPLGPLLRGQIYRPIFAHLGKSVYIQSGVEVLGANLIAIGDETKILRDVVLNIHNMNSQLHIGREVCLDRGVDIRTAGNDCRIEIGNGSYLGPYVCMAGPGHIRIGANCLIAAHSGIYANNHRSYGLSREGIVIEDNCWLGNGVKVLDGVTIGCGSVVGAGAVVTKDIPPNSVAVGVPAKVIKSAEECLAQGL
ncbi:MAG TPA: acyltransferase [Trichocoleus sp.]|jgi:acetyltransferase-like isoleucine patch superfamily enzyme